MFEKNVNHKNFFKVKPFQFFLLHYYYNLELTSRLLFYHNTSFKHL